MSDPEDSHLLSGDAQLEENVEDVTEEDTLHDSQNTQINRDARTTPEEILEPETDIEEPSRSDVEESEPRDNTGENSESVEVDQESFLPPEDEADTLYEPGEWDLFRDDPTVFEDAPNDLDAIISDQVPGDFQLRSSEEREALYSGHAGSLHVFVEDSRVMVGYEPDRRLSFTGRPPRIEGNSDTPIDLQILNGEAISDEHNIYTEEARSSDELESLIELIQDVDETLAENSFFPGEYRAFLYDEEEGSQGYEGPPVARDLVDPDYLAKKVPEEREANGLWEPGTDMPQE